jgi:hypothetical protein
MQVFHTKESADVATITVLLMKLIMNFQVGLIIHGIEICAYPTGFIVDFYCHKAALVIEVDGDIHDLQQEEDARREKVLSEMGLRVVRLRNEDVMKNLSAVVGRIRELVLRSEESSV